MWVQKLMVLVKKYDFLLLFKDKINRLKINVAAGAIKIRSANPFHVMKINLY